MFRDQKLGYMRGLRGTVVARGKGQAWERVAVVGLGADSSPRLDAQTRILLHFQPPCPVLRT